MPAKHVGQLCKRCNSFEAILTVRAEPLCRECFTKYIHTKVVKRMEAFRTRHAAAGQERKLLLPLSFGVSSVSLLHILDRHLQTQKEKTQRTGFSLHVLFIDSTTECLGYASKVALLKAAYPAHDYSVAGLDELFTVREREFQENMPIKDEKTTSFDAIDELLNAAPSATAKADILSILRTRFAVRFAKAHNCEGILWGDSTTKLAEKVLSETAKGRGFSLPWQVSDGLSPYGVPFYYPMRDVLKKELISHCVMTDPPLSIYMDPRAFETTQAPPSAKNTTIDVLMKQYFESVEENYPSIVSNVVRTSSKLQAPVSDSGLRCKLCELPVEQSSMGIQGWGGYQEAGGESEETVVGLCYGCSRSVPAEAVQHLP